MDNNFFSKFNKDIRKFIINLDTYLDEVSAKADNNQQPELLWEIHSQKAKLVTDYLKELVENNSGDTARIAINKLGGQAEGVIKSAVNSINHSDVDTLINFLGQVAQEIFIRDETASGQAQMAVLHFFFYSEHRSQSEKYMGLYLTGKLPLLIYSEIVNGQKDGIGAKLTDVGTKVDDWNQKLEDLVKTKTEVKKLAEELERQKIRFNFLGLSAAFKQFHDDKKLFLYLSLAGMLLIGIALITLPSVTYFKINSINEINSSLQKTINDIDKIIKNDTGKYSPQQSLVYKNLNANLEKLYKQNEFSHLIKLAYMGIPLLAVELLLLYYFRILLVSYTNTRSQIMQLQLRNSVCQFIESYVKFKKENKEIESGFEKFEALIFSGLAPSDDKVPSTFDGLDQLLKLLKSARGTT